MDEHTTRIVDEIAKKKGLFINTTGREPTYLITNRYTYNGLVAQLANAAVTEDPTITFEEAVGLPVVLLPIDHRKEIYVEVV